MASTPITYSCGHTGREQLYGKHSDRVRHVSWAERNKVCPDCYRSQRKEDGPEVLARGDGECVALLVTNSYEQRETLKARGYRFTSWTPADAPLGVKFTKTSCRFVETKGWTKSFSDGKALADELDLFDSLGWSIEVISPILSGLFQSVGEGSRSLLQPLIDRESGHQSLATETIPCN